MPDKLLYYDQFNAITEWFTKVENIDIAYSSERMRELLELLKERYRILEIELDLMNAYKELENKVLYFADRLY